MNGQSIDYSKIFHHLKASLTTQKLQELSVKVIDAHKAKKEGLLLMYADAFFPEDKGNQGTGVKLFLKLIKQIHPDKLSLIHKDLENAFQSKDYSLLDFYNKILFAEREVKTLYRERFDFDFTEEYRYEERDYTEDLWEEETSYNDFGDNYDTSGSDIFDYSKEETRCFDFISALKQEVLGNLDLSLDQGDLQSLEGELDLREYGINELEGLQYCRNITVLDLSCNSIDSLYEIGFLSYLTELYLADNQITDLEPLVNLSNLEILDLSGNDIEDISPLLKLESLSFVDLRGNPVPKDQVFRALERKVTLLI